MDGYSEWFFTVSFPRVISLVEHADDVRPSNFGGTYDGVSLPPPSMVDQQHLHMITVTTDNLMGLVNLNGKVYTLLSQIKHITYGRSM